MIKIYEVGEAMPILKQLLSEEKLNIFVGSGISLGSGIPLWKELVESYMEMASEIVEADSIIITDAEKKLKEDLRQIVSDARLRANPDNRLNYNPIEIATVISSELKKMDSIKISGTEASEIYNNWIDSTFISGKTPNEKHKSIVSTNYKFILTSNFDNLLQLATRECARDLTKSTFSYENQTQILTKINNNESAIIHIHGLAKSFALEDLIFTKDNYNKLILKEYAGFSFALRMLFTRYSTLFVGYGSEDPHIEEIFEEIKELFPIIDDSFKLPESFLVVKRDKADSILAAYKDRVGIRLIVIDKYEDIDVILNDLKETYPRK